MDGQNLVPVPGDGADEAPIPLNKSLVVLKEQLPTATEPEKKKRGRPKKHQAPPHEGSNSGAMAQRYVDRLVNMLTEKREISESISELKTEMKGQGFLPSVIQRLAMLELETADQRAVREAEEEEFDRLTIALGQLKGTPLGDSARP